MAKFKDVEINTLFIFGLSQYEKISKRYAVRNHADYLKVVFPFKYAVEVVPISGDPVSVILKREETTK